MAVTDLDGDRSQGGDLVISVVDDAPVAVADTDSVAAGQTAAETGNVLDGSARRRRAETLGADGAVSGGAVVSVALGGGTAVAVDPATGATIVGAFGTLTLLADGSYSYAPTIGTPGGDHIDTFTYRIKDADGDLSTATLTIAVANSSPGNIDVPPPDMGVTAVFEAGLPARTVGGVTEPRAPIHWRRPARIRASSRLPRSTGCRRWSWAVSCSPSAIRRRPLPMPQGDDGLVQL